MGLGGERKRSRAKHDHKSRRCFLINPALTVCCYGLRSIDFLFSLLHSSPLSSLQLGRYGFRWVTSAEWNKKPSLEGSKSQEALYYPKLWVSPLFMSTTLGYKNSGSLQFMLTTCISTYIACWNTLSRNLRCCVIWRQPMRGLHWARGPMRGRAVCHVLTCIRCWRASLRWRRCRGCCWMTWSSTGCRGWSSGPGRSGTPAPRPPPPPRPSPCPPPRSGWHNLEQNTKYKFVSGELYFLFSLALSWIPDAGQWNDDNMIFDYLIFESYLHISHLIFDIIHPSPPHRDRRSRAAYGKNRFDNSILIHYILLHALSRSLGPSLFWK